MLKGGYYMEKKFKIIDSYVYYDDEKFDEDRE